ncbi:uncharacterized protein LOC129584672 isoform X1 [Paramacrobiotus metropolitanus]|uniref:uncharacterized protein LOC129584672 isoform X1 n=1 Tax=Paramacrobiotus metropolitanus TaxID=2943436 RepID=UPI0024456565|nr:uncharacterized protein LOC129584672 isoform X1 [Paramacrobiotus metropolitanus]XP_055332917.1 uncharacterized protein LOC129584672 isoform X1 [Paramacrobiotus metropolitanus]XP_055332918.1 uncharacterized protein LOC129584672 isoform X1 [Paramacrobiotus metropolitanus]XP_055332919.1 uncharacterized protein LOC129584672 isoform X1 [Paramacrobiotus metropolitanus]XP_055332920.1 uncharacterized protein LOC129584672 isoform X1 [Paramacrobiotus metropolitanus]XP_055332921.1 uncharacterized prot
MPPKAKPNGYALFVLEQSRLNHIDPRAGFSKFQAEWNALDNFGKNYYKEKAKAQKATASANNAVDGGNVQAPPPPPVYDPIANIENFRANNKRAYPDDGYDDDFGDYYDDEDIYVENAPAMVKKVFLVGDDTGFTTEMVVTAEHVNVEEDNELLEVLTKDSELLQNVLEAYRDLNEIRNYHVFVMSCTPVIFAQGIKKGSNRPMNRPVEIAVSAFSIHNGVEKAFYQTFVYPGIIPEIETIHANESKRIVLTTCPLHLQEQSFMAFHTMNSFLWMTIVFSLTKMDLHCRATITRLIVRCYDLWDTMEKMKHACLLYCVLAATSELRKLVFVGWPRKPESRQSGENYQVSRKLLSASWKRLSSWHTVPVQQKWRLKRKLLYLPGFREF